MFTKGGPDTYKESCKTVGKLCLAKC